MNDEDLFKATVPVFAHYTDRVDGIVSGLADSQAVALQDRLTPDSFSAGEHFLTCQGFSLRTVYPLMGQAIPDLSTEQADVPGLRQRCGEVRQLLRALTPSDFRGASERMIRHTAGTAELEQDATTFVTLYGLPNFFFHLTMAYATVRRRGVDVGKGDFDGQHAYPKGFRFT